MVDKTTGKSKLTSTIRERTEDSKHWNEAQNRFQFIDVLLMDCLGWPRASIEVEKRDDGGISDFHLGSFAILEAKRESLDFKFPPSGGKDKITKLRNIYNFCDNAKEAIEQVFNYCARQGIPLAIVCNGPQMIIFQAIVSGQKLLDMDCLYFDGLADYERGFSKLWDYLSPAGLHDGIALSQLNVKRAQAIPPKPSVSISNVSEKRQRDQFQESLNSLCELLLQSLSNHEEVKSDFYRDCYVNLDANNRHLNLSRNLIENRYDRATTPRKPSPLKKTVRTRHGDKPIVDIDPSVLMQASSAEPVVVLGDVGVGKTSFFENLYENALSVRGKDTIFLTIDLGTQASLAAGLKEHVLDSIQKQLQRKYDIDIHHNEFVRSIYHEEISSFSNSIYGKLRKVGGGFETQLINKLSELIGKKDEHLHASLSHLSFGQNKTIVIVIDNADQRNFNIQQDAFLIANELASKKYAVVFIALRPSTYYASKTKGALSAYKSKFFTVSPPPADQVIEKRIQYALRVAQGQVKPKALKGIGLPFTDARDFLRVLLRSLHGDDRIRAFLNNVTGGNIRSVIDLIAGFCGSPNVNSKGIILKEQESGNSIIPLHLITRHSLLTDNKFFHSESSYVSINVFDVDFADCRNHFLRPMIIAFMNSTSSVRDKDGYVTGKNLIRELTKFQFLDFQIRRALQKLCEGKLIETPYSHHRETGIAEDDDPDKMHYRVTSVGNYHVQNWMSEFNYLEIMATDTPVFDADVLGKLTKLAPTFGMTGRVARAKLFKKYLIDQWGELKMSPDYFDFLDLIDRHSDTFKGPERFIAGNKRSFPRRGTSKSSNNRKSKK